MNDLIIKNLNKKIHLDIYTVYRVASQLNIEILKLSLFLQSFVSPLCYDICGSYLRAGNSNFIF